LFSKRLFPYALAACFSLGMIAQTAFAQNADTSLRQLAKANDISTLPIADDDPIIISLASAEDIKNSTLVTAPTRNHFQQLMTAAIDQRLGSPYVWGATGPSAYDCSGFVWSIFQSAGVDFERGSARTLWTRFAAPARLCSLATSRTSAWSQTNMASITPRATTALFIRLSTITGSRASTDFVRFPFRSRPPRINKIVFVSENAGHPFRVPAFLFND